MAYSKPVALDHRGFYAAFVVRLQRAPALDCHKRKKRRVSAHLHVTVVRGEREAATREGER